MQFLKRVGKRLDPYLLLLLVLSGLALTPLFAPGYFYSAHDGRHSVFYLNMFDASIRDGALWPRWAMHHIQGYGYPTFIIQSPLGFYVAEIFMLFGAGPTLAAKQTWAVAFLGSAWGMYRLTIHWLGAEREEPQGIDYARLAGLVAGLLYVYIPYHLAGIYVRGALNDTLLLAWYPWVFLAFDRLIALGGTRGWQRRLGVAILLLACTLLTHTFALISFSPLLVTFVLFRLGLKWWQDGSERAADGVDNSTSAMRSVLVPALMALAGGVGALLLYANFLLPLLVEGQSLQQQVYSTGTYDYRNHFVYFGQFFSPFWGFGFSDDPTGVNDGMGFQVGSMAMLLLIISIYQLWRDEVRWRPTMIYLLVISIALLIFMTPLSASLWAAVPMLGIIQFPWRLLSLVILVISALAGLTTANLLLSARSQANAAGGALVLGLLVMFAGYSYIGAELQPVEKWREDGRAVFEFEREHPDMIALTEWVDEPFTTSPMTPDYASDTYEEEYGRTETLTRIAVIDGVGEVLSQQSAGSSGGGVVQMEELGVVRVHLFYFPGWEARIDGEIVEYRVSPPNGVLELDVPAGEHQIDVRMGATPVRRMGAGISWVMFLIVLGLIFWPQRWSTKKTVA